MMKREEGPLAGPVVAGAVILPESFKHPLLNDSKLISEKNRETLRCVIEKEAIAFGVGILDHTEIDRINILNASFKAMHFSYGSNENSYRLYYN